MIPLMRITVPKIAYDSIWRSGDWDFDTNSAMNKLGKLTSKTKSQKIQDMPGSS